MSARNDLAQLLVKRAGDHIQMLDSGPEEDNHSVSIGLSMNWAAIADIILAAGFHRDRTIDTAEELDALPDGSVVLDRQHDVAEKHSGRLLYRETRNMPLEYLAKHYGPFTVLWEPEAGDE